MAYSIRIMQLVELVWTAVAVLLALALVTSLFAPRYVINPFLGSEQPALVTPGIPWQLSVLMFFVFLLVLDMPAYLLLYLWHRLSEP